MGGYSEGEFGTAVLAMTAKRVWGSSWNGVFEKEEREEMGINLGGTFILGWVR